MTDLLVTPYSPPLSKAVVYLVLLTKDRYQLSFVTHYSDLRVLLLNISL